MHRIAERFLQRQLEEGLALAAASDVVDLLPLDGPPPTNYIARFSCTGLVRSLSGEIVEANEFVVGIGFHDGYLRAADPSRVLTWLWPRNVYHPNISDRAPFICVGRLVPGTSLVDILYQCFEIITYHKVTMREDDALNKDACAWARQNQHRFPIDPRPLKRRTVGFQVEPTGGPVGQ